MATIIKRGSRYRVQIRRKGQPTLSKSFERRSDAKRWIEGVEAKVASGAAVDASEAQQTTLAEALRRYEAEFTPSKRGKDPERYRIKKWLRDPLASRSLGSIRSIDVAEWRTARVAEGRAPSSIRNSLTIISQVYKVAASEWGMEGLRNPVAGVRLPSNRPGRDRRLEPGEEQRLLDACSCPYTYAAIIVSIETAMRQGELLGLRWDAIQGRMAMLRDTKNGKARAVPLSSRAWAAIESLPRSIDGKVFPISAGALDYQWRAIRQSAGSKDLRWHDLRHEGVSRLFEKGLSAEEVMQLSGHTTYAMLARYTHLRSASLLQKLG